MTAISAPLGRHLIVLARGAGCSSDFAGRGLRWSRADLDAMTVRVDAQINRCDEIVKAKTKRSVRTTRVDAVTVARFATWREQLHVEKGYPVHQIVDWPGTSERMIIDWLPRVIAGPPLVSPLESGTWSPRDR